MGVKRPRSEYGATVVFDAEFCDQSMRTLSSRSVFFIAETMSMELLNAAVEQARHDPKAAQQLFALTTLGYREDEDRRQHIRETFDKLGVPREFLSH